MRTNTSVGVLILYFSDLESIMKTFNVQQTAQLEKHPMPRDKETKNNQVFYMKY